MPQNLASLSLRKLWQRMHPRFDDDIEDGNFDVVSITDPDCERAKEFKRFTGMTGFFRFQWQYDALEYTLSNINSDPLRILVTGGSIGCEARGLSIGVEEIAPKRRVQIDSVDLSELFTEVARRGYYPSRFLHKSVESEYPGAFQPAANGFYRLNPKLESRVSILPASDILDFKSDQPYDLVYALSYLYILPPEKVPDVLLRLGDLTNHVLCVDYLEDIDSKTPGYVTAEKKLRDNHFRLLDKKFQPSSGYALPFVGSAWKSDEGNAVIRRFLPA